MDPFSQSIANPVSQILFIGIGNAVAWLAALYVKGAARDLIVNVVVCTAGAFVAGYLSLRFFPAFDKPGMMVGAFVGAVLLLAVTRLKTWYRRGKGR